LSRPRPPDNTSARWPPQTVAVLCADQAVLSAQADDAVSSAVTSQPVTVRCTEDVDRNAAAPHRVGAGKVHGTASGARPFAPAAATTIATSRSAASGLVKRGPPPRCFES
jgi:hypothetical protein